MFYHININEEFRDNYRILYNLNSSTEEPMVYQFRRLMMGTNQSPCITILTIHLHFDNTAEEKPRLKRIYKLRKSHLYVDDLIIAVKSVEEAIQSRPEITEIFASMKMKIKNGHQTIQKLSKLCIKKIYFHLK